MARLFNSSTHSITASVGAFSGAPFTYGMHVAILRWSAVAGWMEYYSNQVASGDLYFGIEISGNNLVCSYDGSTQSTSNFTPSQDVWYCVITTKATGTAAPRWNVYNYSTNTWTTSVADNAGGDGAGNMGSHYLGSYQGSFEFFAGHIAAMGLFRQVVPSSDAAIQALGLPFSRNAWFNVARQADRSAFWLFDQSVTSSPVRDLTGGGANESGGTTPQLGTLSVPLFSYGAPITNAPPGVTGGGGPYTDDVNTTGTVVTDVTDVLVSVPKFKSAGTPTETISNSSVAWPTHAIGDVALLLLESAGGEAITLTNAQGFTQVTNSPSATGTGTAGTRLTAYWHRATSTSMAAPEFADAGNHVYGVILTFTDCISSGDPIDVTAAAQKASASTSMTMPAVTTTVGRTLVCNCAARDNDNAAAAGSSPSNANLANLTERFDLGTALGNGGGIMVWCGEKVSAGSTGTTSATVTSSINAYLTIALKGNQAAGTGYTDDVNTTVVGVTNETDVLGYTESVNTVIVGVTNSTEVLALTETVDTVVVGVTSSTDVAALVDTVDTVVVGVTDVADTQAITTTVDTVIVGVTDSTELLALTEQVTTTAVVVTPTTDVGALVDTVQTDVLGVTDVEAVAVMTETVSTTIVGETTLVDSLAALSDVVTTILGVTDVVDMFSYNENVQNIIVGVTTTTDVLAVTEDQTTLGTITNEVAAVAAFNDLLNTVILGITTQGDSLGILEQTVTTGTGVTDVTALLAMLEDLTGTVTGLTTVGDLLVGTESVETVINGVTSETDIYNEGEPGEPILAYQAPPWKVIGYR